MMEYLIDDNYVPLDSTLGNVEYLMEKILLDAQYMENLRQIIPCRLNFSLE